MITDSDGTFDRIELTLLKPGESSVTIVLTEKTLADAQPAIDRYVADGYEVLYSCYRGSAVHGFATAAKYDTPQVVAKLLVACKLAAEFLQTDGLGQLVTGHDYFLGLRGGMVLTDLLAAIGVAEITSEQP